MLCVADNPGMNAMSNETELRVTVSAIERIRGWVAVQLHFHARSGLTTALVLALFGVIANVVVFLSVLFLALQLMPRMFANEIVFEILAVVVLLLMYPTYVFGGRPGSRKFKLRSGTVVLAAEVYTPPEFLPGPRTAEKDWHMFVDYCTFPAWLLHKAWRHLKAPAVARAADRETMARVLTYLLQEQRRISIHDLEDAMPTPRMAGAINALVYVPGVLVFHEDYPALALNDELQQTLRGML